MFIVFVKCLNIGINIIMFVFDFFISFFNLEVSKEILWGFKVYYVIFGMKIFYLRDKGL